MILNGTSGTTDAATVGTESAQDKAKLEDDLNKFLNLLVTQLKNQDPLDPLDANEFTSQLVQFASVEQQIYQNSNLEKMLALQTTTQIADMVNYIGMTVESPGKLAPLENSNLDFSYSIGSNVDQIIINIQDSSGVTVYSIEGDNEAGTHRFTWDGETSSGEPQEEGTYTVNVVGLDSKGEIQDISQTVFGRITGAGGEGGNIQLFMGDVGIAMDKILSVTETKAAAAAAP